MTAGTEPSNSSTKAGAERRAFSLANDRLWHQTEV